MEGGDGARCWTGSGVGVGGSDCRKVTEAHIREVRVVQSQGKISGCLCSAARLHISFTKVLISFKPRIEMLEHEHYEHHGIMYFPWRLPFSRNISSSVDFYLLADFYKSHL